MKTKCLIMSLIALLFLFAGCSKDEFFGEEPDSNLKSAQLKMLPISWDIHVVITKYEFPGGHPTPTGGPMEGIVSHLGLLKEGSYWEADSYIRDDDATPSTVDYEISGKLVAANGDELNLTTVGTITHLGPVEAEWIGKMYFSGGTGRFENAVGEAESQGWLTRDENGIPHSVDMHLEGKLSSVGSSKR
jgi:hypothetical protein